MDRPNLASNRQFLWSLIEALRARHDIVMLPHHDKYAPPSRRSEIAEAFVQQCDLIVGVTHAEILKARQRLGSNIPYVYWALGTLPRGGFPLVPLLPYLTSNDVMLVNCTADVALAGKLIRECKVALLPLAFDVEMFYPVTPQERCQLRAKHGFDQDDRILIYAGGVNASKNVHTILRIFGAVLQHVPNAHLIVAGATDPGGGLWQEWGLIPVRYDNTYQRAVATLGLPEDRLHRLAKVTGEELCELLNLADLTVNMTLSHDEHVGLSQLEALACGTPVIGSAWGGLKDMIIDGKSGFGVSTAITATGAKVNWWEAVNRIVQVLTDPAQRADLRDRCLETAQCYTPASFEQRLGEILTNTVASVESSPRTLDATGFAKEYWDVCDPKQGTPIYRRGPRSLELYRELIAAYCGASAQHVPMEEPLQPDQVLCLPTPIDASRAGHYRLDDPHYPFELDLPPTFLDCFIAMLTVLRDRPAITVGELISRGDGHQRWLDTLRWLLSNGLLLRSRAAPRWIAPVQVGEHLGRALFAVQPTSLAADFLLTPGS